MIENLGTLGHKCVVRNQVLPTSNKPIVATSFSHHFSLALNIHWYIVLAVLQLFVPMPSNSPLQLFLLTKTFS